MTLISPIRLDIADRLEKDKEFRKHFFRVQAQDRIAMKIKGLRKKRKKTQVDLAKESKMLQSAVSRIEQADYCGWSLNTLFRVADALEARLRVSFEPVEDVIDWYRKKEEAAIATDDEYICRFVEHRKINEAETSTVNFSNTVPDSSFIQTGKFENVPQDDLTLQLLPAA